MNPFVFSRLSLKRAVLVLLGATALSGCASIVSDNNSATYIETDPEKSRCELHGQDFTRIVETPNSLNLPSSAAPITVACQSPGYKSTTGTLDTKLDGWIFGNLIFGGIVGVVIDAARGAGQKYPQKYSLVLEPEQFRSLSERDVFYDKRKKQAEEKWGRVLSDIERQCGSAGNPARPDCGQALSQAQTEQNKELAEIEANRAKATIGS